MSGPYTNGKPKEQAAEKPANGEPRIDESRYGADVAANEMIADRLNQQNLSQDSALLKLLASVLAPYKGWMILALVLMVAVASLNAVPPYLLGQAVDGLRASTADETASTEAAAPGAADAGAADAGAADAGAADTGAANEAATSGTATGEAAAEADSEPLVDPIDRDGLLRLALLYGAVAIGIFVLTFAYTYFLQQAGQRALADLRSRLFNHILTRDNDFLARVPTGDLVARLTSDVDTLNAVLSQSVVVVLVEGFTLIVIVVVMLALNWQLALISLAILPVVALVTRYFRERIRRSSTGERAALARVSAFLNEHIHGMDVVQLFGRQQESEQEYDGYNAGYRESLIDLRRHSAVFLSVQEVLVAVGIGLILYGGGRGVLADWATLGVLVAFVQYTQRAYQPVLQLSQQYNAIQIALGAAERIYRMLQEESEISSPAEPTPLPLGDARTRGDIRFENVHFAYVEDEPVLRGIDLHIPPGQTVAVVGATGAGKSSLVALLARNYDPQRGQVKLDGIDLRELDLDILRRAVAVVPQDPVCLAGTIRHNICLYRDDVSEQQMVAAAEATNAARFIEELPGSYDFEILAGGANLSQGQRQLLALARALALSPDGVLVLDEATSSIDTATEALIQDALDRILRTRTSLVIAHRLSTVRSADRIIVMDRGRIVEDGDHVSLLAKGGWYARLHHHQVVPEELSANGQVRVAA